MMKPRMNIEKYPHPNCHGLVMFYEGRSCPHFTLQKALLCPRGTGAFSNSRAVAVQKRGGEGRRTPNLVAWRANAGCKGSSPPPVSPPAAGTDCHARLSLRRCATKSRLYHVGGNRTRRGDVFNMVRLTGFRAHRSNSVF